MDEFKRAFATSLRILSRKSYSRNEIFKKLINFEYDEDIVLKVLKELEKLGFINDDDYADQIITDYSARGYGIERVKNELYKRLIDKEIIDDKTDDILADFDIILNYYEQKLKGDTKDYSKTQKTKAFLQRKGFSFDEINKGFALYKEKLEDE